MDKRIFTMLTAGLLPGGSAFNAVYADGAKTVIAYSGNETALANGTQFYLGTATNQAYAITNVLTTKDKKKVVSLDLNTQVDPATSGSAAIFTVRNYSSRTFELWAVADVNGTKTAYQVVTTTDGQTLTQSVAAGKNFSDLNTTFVVKEGKLKFSGLYTVTLPSVEVGSAIKAFSYSEPYCAKELNEYNSKGTTLSFDYTTNELVGNLFENLTPVTISSTINGTTESIQAGTYFLKGDAKKIKAFVDEVKDGSNAEATIEAAKEIAFLAVDPTNRYDINGKKDNEGYALYFMKGEVAVASPDSCNNANFDITAKDVLNEDGVLELVVDYTKKDATRSTKVYVAAVKPSVSDTKTYVTSILKSGTDYKMISHPQLGANSYLDASILLKKNAENVVNVYPQIRNL